LFASLRAERSAQRKSAVRANLAESVLNRWRKEYAARGEAAFTPKEPSQEDASQHKIAELERFCGQLALENAILKKALQAVPTRSDTPC